MATKDVFVKKIGLTLFLAMLMHSFTASADLWTVTQQWSPEMEVKYSEWLKTNARVDMFSREFLDAKKTIKNPYYGITTDCADTVYSLRVIFSFENGLPWAIKNPANPKSLIAQSMKRYDKFPEGVTRVREFLKSLYDTVSTSSLQRDTYPVSINSIRPGVIILTSKINHHSWTIADIDAKGNPRLIYNSVVGKASGSKLQQRQSWPNPFWVYQAEEKPTNPLDPLSPTVKVPVYVNDSYAGLRYWIPVEQLQADTKLLPEYSNDQFALDLKDWKQTIQNKLAVKKESLQEVVQRLLTDACDDVKQRMTAVEEASLYKSQLNIALSLESKPGYGNIVGQMAATPIDQNIIDILNEYKKGQSTVLANPKCLIAKQYDLLSTPSRDRRLFDAVVLARSYFVKGLAALGEKAFTPIRLKQFKRIFANPELSAKEESDLATTKVTAGELSVCRVKVGSETLDMAEIKRRLFKSWLSSNPNEDTLGRWGGREGKQLDLAAQCTTYGETYAPYDLNQAEADALHEIETYQFSN